MPTYRSSFTDPTFRVKGAMTRGGQYYSHFDATEVPCRYPRAWTRAVKEHVAKLSKPDLYLAIRTLVITAVLYAGFYTAFPYYSKNWALWSLAAKAHVARFSQPDLYLAVRTVIITVFLYAGFFAAYPLVAKHWALWAIAICLRAGLNVRIIIIVIIIIIIIVIIINIIS
ncbi:hypothetical protein COCSUDRAFT_58173 [Coccomyxa subellipsoidea C-169]|uniref:Uncharacterized protein n=1 Tax=Coccomyxa subellipsoidea (strain C-169) TaxID=574566 RepID=I0YNG8_COCSC|nr:hypothetical protein COCSUDRAFT_58173 [Coccomyxa subellipsoidea C-169]EIE19937.1 hypothetical protein COCSUDRAFT_58173 [Coccomyxa subellipsoidea C-169]|eukprot:XP_005644481.1 hypothetical protein COCSUDRAFT_58173 [Coccomyxa subellipsoidea C-169]